MAEVTTLERIVNTLATATSLKPVVKGGNRSNPLEYLYTRTGMYSYRLELDINGKDILSIDSISSSIYNAIANLGDTNQIENCSIEPYGGGSFSKDNIVTQVLYFIVTDYNEIWR